MIEPRFSYRASYDKTLTYEELKERLGLINHKVKLPIDTLHNIFDKHKNASAVALQRFETDHRVCKEDEDKPFNHTVLIDFDYKNIWEKGIDGLVDPQYVYLYLASKLNEKSYFYYMENSLHHDSTGKYDSAHILFYYNNSTFEDYGQYYIHARNTVIEILKEIKNDVLIEHIDEVLDNCGKSPLQYMFCTFKNCYFNNRCTGESDIVLDENFHKKESRTIKTKNEFTFACTKVDEAKDIEYIEHTRRWILFCSLSRVFEGDDLKREWTRCAKLLPEQNGHKTDYYINCPYTICDWNRNLKGDEYCDIELLKKFGYDVTIKNNKKLSNINYLLNLFMK